MSLRTYFAGRFVAQEARKSSIARGPSDPAAGGSPARSTSGGVESRHATHKHSACPEAPEVGIAGYTGLAVGNRHRLSSAMPPAGVAPGPLTLPWPPSGNHAVRHTAEAHYVRQDVIAYRDSVAGLLHGRPRVIGRYRLHVHLSPPDARERDIDNCLKSLFDAMVRCEFLPTDSMTHMRELLITVDDARSNHVRVRVAPVLEAA